MASHEERVRMARLAMEMMEDDDDEPVEGSSLGSAMVAMQSHREQETEREDLMRELQTLEEQLARLEHEESVKEQVVEAIRDDVTSLRAAFEEIRKFRIEAENAGRETEAVYRRHLQSHSTTSSNLVTALMEAVGAAYDLHSGQMVDEAVAERQGEESQALCNDREEAQHHLNLQHVATKQRLAALEDELADVYREEVAHDAEAHVEATKRLALWDPGDGKAPASPTSQGFIPEDQVLEVARLRCKLASMAMAKRSSITELVVGQMRIEQQLSMLGDELQKCPSPNSSPSTRGDESPEMDSFSRQEELTAEIEADCERLLAVHEQLRNYLLATDKGDEQLAEEFLDTNHRDGAGVPSEAEREELQAKVKTLFEECSTMGNDYEAKVQVQETAQVEMQRLSTRCRRWEERQKLEVSARASAVAELTKSKDQLEAMQSKFSAGGSENQHKLKVIQALLDLVASEPQQKLAQGEFVSITLSMADLDNALL